MNASIAQHFSTLKDPRIERHKKHKLVDIIMLSICAILSGAEGWEAIEEYGHAKLEWLRRFIPLEQGIPAHDTIARVLSRVSAKGLQQCFINWVAAVHEVTAGQVVAIDGKTVRRSYDREARKSAIHMVSAWGSANGLVLGRLKTAENSNEITAIPELLELLEIKGCIVTLDAMGCQKEIAGGEDRK
jgi:predicted transposase YbfD/YdcC